MFWGTSLCSFFACSVSARVCRHMTPEGVAPRLWGLGPCTVYGERLDASSNGRLASSVRHRSARYETAPALGSLRVGTTVLNRVRGLSTSALPMVKRSVGHRCSPVRPPEVFPAPMGSALQKSWLAALSAVEPPRRLIVVRFTNTLCRPVRSGKRREPSLYARKLLMLCNQRTIGRLGTCRRTLTSWR